MVKILQLIGIDDSDTAGILYLSPDPKRMRYNFTGNVELLPFLENKDFEIFKHLVGGMKGDPASFPKVDMVFNSICDPDSSVKALNIASNIVNALKIPVFNDPRRMMKTRRENMYQMLSGMEGVIAPKTLRIYPKYVSEIVKVLESGQMTCPFLMRMAGSHNGMNLELIRDLKDMPELDKFPFDGRAYYMTQFIPYRSKDGFYRKYRVAVVNGKPYPKHLVVADDWKVRDDSGKAVMDSHPEFQEEEKVFLKESYKKDASVLSRIHETLGLDYFGVDFSYAENGRMIIFEVNSCFRTIGSRENPVDYPYPYTEPYVKNIKKAIEEVIRAKAAGKTEIMKNTLQ
jgi:glutathione synthase/RimK-type ligase-like ATP-grasp enzyme